MKKNWIYIVGLKDGRIFEAIYRGTLRGYLCWEAAPFIDAADGPDWINPAQIEWLEPVMQFDWTTTTLAKYQEAREALLT